MPDERTLSRLVVVGASHRTSSETTRDRLFIAEHDIPGFLAGVCEAGFVDAVVMSTCARTEIFGLASDRASAQSSAVAAIAQLGGFDVAEIQPQTYFYESEEALRHLFRVCAALDSPIIGEPMVTGQFREAVRAAEVSGFLSSELSNIVQAANRTSKRVRNETAIGQRPVSMATCAAQVAGDVHGALERAKAVLVTGGEMGEMIADQIRDAGLSHITVVARSRARAEISARRYNCHFAALEELPRVLPLADIVITSMGAGRYLFDRENVSAALFKRRRRPMLFLDAAIPSDIDPEVNDLDGAFLYSLDDLERIVLEGRIQRKEILAEAESIIEAEIQDFLRDIAARDAVPVVTALRQHFECIRLEVLSDSGHDPLIEEVTRRLTNRLLHDPSETLRNLAATQSDNGLNAEGLVRLLFGLTDEDDKSVE